MEYNTLGAVDLGSNSFHLAVARVVDDQLYPLDSLREAVRLGSGLTPDKHLDSLAEDRAIAALKRFSERLAGMPREAVRVVGTNALRVAKNAGPFLRRAQATLGFPIEVISGREEARLIYLGVVHSLPLSPHNRLVVDIGGGSTECIIGNKLRPKAMESLYMGCVSYTARFFPEGRVEKKALKQAQFAAREQVQPIAARFQKTGWKEAVGSSGTARSIAEVLAKNGQAARGINAAGLEWLREQLVAAGDLRKLALPGLREDRVPVVAGGVAIMSAVFDELGLDEMTVAEGALRDGVLWDLLGRVHHRDIREVTVEQFAHRYHVDLVQSQRVPPSRTSCCASSTTGRASSRRSPISSPGPRSCTRSASPSRRAPTTSTRPTSSPTRTCRAFRARNRGGCRTSCSRSAASSRRCAPPSTTTRGSPPSPSACAWR